MRLSYVIVTRNRRASLLRVLDRIEDCTPLPRDAWDVLVVDNASTDGTLEAVRRAHPSVSVIRRARNEGVWARTCGIEAAAGQYVVLLDDDSYPSANAVARSLQYLDRHQGTAAVVGRIVLPDGGPEACAMPAVMLSGAVCARRDALLQVGGFRREFFRKAGEYDLSFRLWDAGHRIERFDDIVYRHDKVLSGRDAALAHRMDVRNNLILVSRFLPAPLRRVYWRDWALRYGALARHAGHGAAARRGLWEARGWRLREAVLGRQTLRPQTIQTVFDLDGQSRRIVYWARQQGVKKVVLADLSKNLYATYAASIHAGLKIVAVADNASAFEGLSYRGLSILPDDAALKRAPDGIALSNVNPAQVDRRLEQLRARFDGPILRLWEPRLMSAADADRVAPLTPARGVEARHRAVA